MRGAGRSREQPGIFIVPAAGGGTPTLVREEGSNPRFDATGTRIYFQRAPRRRTRARQRRPPATPTRSSTRVPRTPLELVPSPDGRWIAFEERWRTYVAPFAAERPADRDRPDGEGVAGGAGLARRGLEPALVRRLHTIHWTLGADLYTRDLARRSRSSRDGAEKPDEPEAAGVAIGFEQASDKPSGHDRAGRRAHRHHDAGRTR